MKNKRHKILIVDDEVDICRALEFLLSREDYEIVTAHSAERALEMFEKSHFELMLTDIKMEGMDGIGLMREVAIISPETIPVIMTAFASVESAVDAMKNGAADYIVKPFINDDVKLTINRLLNQRRLESENQALRRQLSDRIASSVFIGDSPSIRRIFEDLEKVIPTKSNILILGESGTGKGVIAEIVHMNSPRKERPFLSINCSAIPETLLESELFGYRKGAFTGANSDKKGLIEAADGGTLFLDEIGDMPIALQSKLLKVLESGEVMLLGDTRTRSVDVRFIAATNKDLEKESKSGRFREDLYYRLDVIQITIPPLRQRRDDIEPLARHLLDKFSRKYEKGAMDITSDAMRALINYKWGGNVRELSNVIERAVVLCSGKSITIEMLPPKVTEGGMPGQAESNLKDALNYYERKLILDKLNAHSWNKDDVAKELGIDLATLYRKMKKLNINPGKEE